MIMPYPKPKRRVRNENSAVYLSLLFYLLNVLNVETVLNYVQREHALVNAKTKYNV